MTKKLTRKEKNAQGYAQGYGECLCCGDSWLWKEHYRDSIKFSATQSMFPLCDECFENLTQEEILAFCKAQCRQWEQFDLEILFSDIEPMLKESIAKMKGDDDGC